ncbi:MAG: sugar ABC transporter permease [Trueperaceae bacterium]|nr:sugar ABC transporter permease [Trueperaceae bacterium]MCC6311122.1 sugar ABC transporter permease [Trueperaceae bacterium]MCO5174805.1 sugar ABC transporter permease [Trueperaceae bacterium]MCW5818643.1 sugar ABC transporter permease [Trueperaceae bacterium]
MTRRQRRDLWLGLAFVSPWLIGFVVFTVYPVLASLYFSFTDYNVVSAPRWIGARNYTDLIADPLFGKTLYNTLYLAAIGIPFSLGLSLVIAMLLNNKVRLQGLFRTVYFLPSVVPAVAAALLWRWFLNPDYGPVNEFLWQLGINGPGWLADPTWSKPALIIASLWGVGGSMVIYLAGLQNVPVALYEAADLDGASRWQRFRFVTLPMLSPVILFNLIMGIITSFQAFTNIYIMTGGGPSNSTLVYALYLYQNAFQFFRMGYASAMAWVLLAITAVALVGVFRTSGWVYYEARS